MKLNVALFMLAAATLCGQKAYSQNTPVDDPGELIGATEAITTAVPFLSITPDARHAALGDAGVATTPDANAAYWNAGKLAFIDKKFGGSLSYTPWLGKIVNDMWISSLTGFYKISPVQAVATSLKYFDLGDINFRGAQNQDDGTFNPKEMSWDITYSRVLSENLGVGVSGRYIYSNLTGAFISDAQAGNSVAADIGIYYNKPLQSTRNSILSLGAQISNIGAKLSYTDNANKDFLPTNLRLGGTFTTELSLNNTITFVLDFNKLMVPSRNNDKSVLSGMFGSFSDAPGGAKEEFKEIIISGGVEYWYNNIFAARLGYFSEAESKGNRKYMTFGVGFQKDNFTFDGAYIVPTNQREHPLAETWRITIMLQIPNQDKSSKEPQVD
jgi:hypothetical protein